MHNHYNLSPGALNPLRWLKSVASIFFLACLLWVSRTPTLAQNYAWAKNMGGTNVTADGGGRSIAVDNLGYIYTTGSFEGTVDFDPGIGVTNLTSAGNKDIFISKLDASGNLLWAKRIGGTGDDRGNGIAVHDGNVYITGIFDDEEPVDFDPGPGETMLTSAKWFDIFISKLDASGNLLWAKRIGGSEASDFGNGIAVDASGSAYITGDFEGTVDFDPGSGTEELTSNRYGDMFVCKLDALGNYVWAKNMGGNDGIKSTAIAIDALGSVYTTGEFVGTVDFNPASGTANLTSQGNWDIFISKLDASGNYVWARSMGSTDYDGGLDIAVDASRNVYTTGRFSGTIDFDPGTATANLTSTSGGYFISKLDASGNYVWARNIRGRLNAITLDASSNVYTTGSFSETVDFDPGTGTAELESVSFSSDIFVCKLDASGNYAWARRMGGNSEDGGTDITLDASGNVYTTGSFQGTADFDPGTATANLTSAGKYDIFISKLGPPPTITTSESPALCAGAASFTIPYTATTRNPITYSISGTGITPVTDATLPVTPITVSFSSPVPASSYAYTLTVKNADGVISDKVEGSVMVNALPTPSASTSPNVCMGQSINLVASGGSTYSWAGPSGYTSSQQIPAFTASSTALGGIYSVTAMSNGCTASATTSVSVIPPPTASIVTSANSICSNQTLRLTAMPNLPVLTYRWAGPDSFSSTLQSPTRTGLTTAMSGIYTVTVTRPACNFTSSATVSMIVSPNSVALAPQMTALAFNGSAPNAQTNTVSVCAGSPVSLNITANQFTLAYNWRGPAGVSGNGFMSAPLSGVTNASASISAAVAANQQGQYTVTVRNACSVINHRVINLQVRTCTNARLASADEASLGLDISLAPNPLREVLEVNVTGIEGESLQLGIHDAQGRSLQQVSIEAAEGKAQHRFDLRSLPAGLYLLQAESNSQRASKKVIKMD